MADKPLRFGDDTPDSQKAVESDSYLREEMDRDPSYVPGYSEQVKANDLDKADNFQRARYEDEAPNKATREDIYQRLGTGPGETPVKMRWIRIKGLDGNENDHTVLRRKHTWERRGYRPVSKEDLEEWGYGMSPGAHEADDGTIRRYDTALFAVDRERAEENERRRRAQTSRQDSDQVAGQRTGIPISKEERELDETIVQHK